MFQDDTQANLILEVIRNDPLRKMERQMKQEAERSILTAAKLISPVIENNFSAGYNWWVTYQNTTNCAAYYLINPIPIIQSKSVYFIFLFRVSTFYSYITIKSLRCKDWHSMLQQVC